MKQRDTEGGFTLIELMIVLAIVALLAVVGARSVKSLSKADLKSNTVRMSGAMRYLFDRASTTGQCHRLVIDLDEGKYWAEVSDDRYFAPREAENDRQKRQRETEEAKRDEDERQRRELAEAAGSDPTEMAKALPTEFRPKRVRFAAFKDMALKPVQMKNTRVMDVYTPRIEQAVTQGRAYVYFFPLGQAEPAIVHLSDPEGERIFSLVIHPITGRVRIYNEYVNLPQTGRADDEGTTVLP